MVPMEENSEDVEEEVTATEIMANSFKNSSSYCNNNDKHVTKKDARQSHISPLLTTNIVRLTMISFNMMKNREKSSKHCRRKRHKNWMFHHGLPPHVR
jgi:hypothetical protein